MCFSSFLFEKKSEGKIYFYSNLNIKEKFILETLFIIRQKKLN